MKKSFVKEMATVLNLNLGHRSESQILGSGNLVLGPKSQVSGLVYSVIIIKCGRKLLESVTGITKDVELRQDLHFEIYLFL